MSIVISGSGSLTGLTEQGLDGAQSIVYRSVPAGTSTDLQTRIRELEALLALKAQSGVNSDIVSLSGITSINGSQLAGMRNRIINGDCSIQQRPSNVFPVGAMLYAGPDRFHSQNILAGGQFTQSAGTMTYGGVVKNTVRQTVNTPPTSITGSSYWHGIYQAIEGVNSYDLIGKPFVVSFIFNSNLAGTYSVTVRDGTMTKSYVSSFTVAANIPTKVTLSVPANSSLVLPNSVMTGLNVTVGFLNTGTLQAASINTWLSGDYLSAPGVTNWGATAGNFIELTELQLEEGLVATPFERRSIGLEMQLCKRYYHVHDNQNSTNLHGFSYVGGNLVVCEMDFPVKMRTIPTVAYTLGAGSTTTPTGIHISTNRVNFIGSAAAGYFFVSEASANAEL